MGKERVNTWKEQSKTNGIFEMNLYSDGSLEVLHNGVLLHIFNASVSVWLWDSLTNLFSKGKGMNWLDCWGTRRRKNEAMMAVLSQNIDYDLET